MYVFGIDLIMPGVPDMEVGQRFCLDYRSIEVEDGIAGATFHAKDGTGLAVRPATGRAFPMGVVPPPSLRETLRGAPTRRRDAIGALSFLG